jgi:hypothetical protein
VAGSQGGLLGVFYEEESAWAPGICAPQISTWAPGTIEDQTDHRPGLLSSFRERAW